MIVVGAGPAGRALAHRAVRVGLDVILIDPAPHRAWTSTYGMYVDDAPEWLDADAVAARSDRFLVFTPHRRSVERGYLVLDPVRFQHSLTLDGVRVVEQRAVTTAATDVTLADGTRLRAGAVVDARGTARVADRVPRQTAYGVFTAPEAATNEPTPVLMDWRTAGSPAPRTPSFSYRVDTARGRLTQETCLAGRPPIPLAELERRHRRRHPGLHGTAVETVDFPMYVRRSPWRDTGAVRFGAVGGLMHPATGYSVAQSLAAADLLVEAVRSRSDLRSRLWTRSARAVYSLRLVGLAVLSGLDGADLVRFFDAFFRLPVHRQRAYLSDRDDVRGTIAAMGAVFLRCPFRLKLMLIVGTVTAPRSLSA